MAQQQTAPNPNHKAPPSQLDPFTNPVKISHILSQLGPTTRFEQTCNLLWWRRQNHPSLSTCSSCESWKQKNSLFLFLPSTLIGKSRKKENPKDRKQMDGEDHDEHESYGGDIPDEGEMEADVDMTGADEDPNSNEVRFLFLKP